MLSLLKLETPPKASSPSFPLSPVVKTPVSFASVMPMGAVFVSCPLMVILLDPAILTPLLPLMTGFPSRLKVPP